MRIAKGRGGRNAWPLEATAPAPRKHVRNVAGNRPKRLAGRIRWHDTEDEPPSRPNAAVSTSSCGQDDEERAAASRLLERFPRCSRRWDRSAWSTRQRDNQNAANCTQKSFDVIRAHPDPIRSRLRGRLQQARRPPRPTCHPDRGVCDHAREAMPMRHHKPGSKSRS